MNPVGATVPVMINQQTPQSLTAGSDTDQIARKFESLLLAQMLKQMRASTGEGLFPGDKSDTLGGLFDSYISDFIAENGGIGLGKSISQSMRSAYQDTIESTQPSPNSGVIND